MIIDIYFQQIMPKSFFLQKSKEKLLVNPLKNLTCLMSSNLTHMFLKVLTLTAHGLQLFITSLMLNAKEEITLMLCLCIFTFNEGDI